MPEVVPLPEQVRAVLDFWFGPLDADGLATQERVERWWRKDPSFDAEVRERFEGVWERAARDELADWAAAPEGAVALILVLDQLPRNMFRDGPEMFATDGAARALTLAGIEAGLDRELVSHHGAFFYMPLMHSESRVDQHLGVRMFEVLRDRSPAGAREAISSNLDFMVRHFEIVDRFGCFPHRNAILGRESTPEERAFLEQPGSSF